MGFGPQVSFGAFAEAGVFVQQYFRDLMPGQVGFAYSIGGSAVTAVP